MNPFTVPSAIADRYARQDCPDSAAMIREAITKGGRILTWRALVGMRGTFQREAVTIAEDQTPRECWEAVQRDFPDVYDSPAWYAGTQGPFVL